ncbi:MAG: glucosyltransferase domain-containing protein [Lachnospiraceae bacterium]|nr:glucosyltransferase domain-containing protein [Lachnospiraceae bacterium]
MIKKICEKKLLLFSSFIAVLLLFGTDAVSEFATDTYSIFNNSSWESMIYANGRLINGIVFFIFENFLKLPQTTVYEISYCIGLVLASLSVFLLADLLIKHHIEEKIALIISAFCILNIFSIEYFLFIETGLFFTAIFLVVIAVRQTVDYLENGDKKRFIQSFLFMILAVYIYQAVLGLYIVLNLPFIIKYSKNSRSFIKNNLIVASVYSVGMLIGLITTKFLLKSQRLEENDIGGIRLILDKIKEVLITDRYFSLAMRIVLIFVALLIAVSCFVFAWKKHDLKSILLIFYIVFLVAFTSFLPQFLGIIKSFEMRIVYPSASVFGVLFIHLMLNCNAMELLERKKCLVFSIMIFCFIIQLFLFNHIFICRYKVNQADKIIAEAIIGRIEKYEHETGENITKIVFYKDMNASRSYDGVNTYSFIYKAFDKVWSDLEILDYYSGRKFARGEALEEYRVLFSNNDWNSYSEDELIFDGDTLHLCCF